MNVLKFKTTPIGSISAILISNNYIFSVSTNHNIGIVCYEYYLTLSLFAFDICYQFIIYSAII